MRCPNHYTFLRTAGVIRIEDDDPVDREIDARRKPQAYRLSRRGIGRLHPIPVEEARKSSAGLLREMLGIGKMAENKDRGVCVHPFTAPAASPDTSHRCAIRKRTMIGMVAMMAPAAKSFQFCPNCALRNP